MTPDGPDQGSRAPRALEAFQVVLLIFALIAVPAAFTLRTIRHPGRLEIGVDDPTPLGYSVSLLLFLIPLAALASWFFRRRDLRLARRAFWRTLLVLLPLGFVLDLLFGNAFFTFPNHAAVLGPAVPGVGGPIPIEEFVFYLSGFMVVLLMYVWADEYWMAAYNVPDYEKDSAGVPRIVGFHGPSLTLGAALVAAAFVYKKTFSPAPDGYPWYATYLIVASFVPSVGFFRTVQPFVNWRAFIFTGLFILLVSLLWEATLGVPYGWWGYRPEAMMGVTIGAWSGLPLEAVFVWMAVTYTTVIGYEVVKIWLAMNRPASRAFFGVGEGGPPREAEAAPTGVLTGGG